MCVCVYIYIVYIYSFYSLLVTPFLSLLSVFTENCVIQLTLIPVTSLIFKFMYI